MIRLMLSTLQSIMRAQLNWSEALRPSPSENIPRCCAQSLSQQCQSSEPPDSTDCCYCELLFTSQWE